MVPYKAPSSGWRRKSVRQLLFIPRDADHRSSRSRRPRPRRPACSRRHHSRFRRDPIYSPIALAEYVEKHAEQTDRRFTVRAQATQSRPCRSRRSSLPTSEKKPRIGIAWDTTGRMSIAHPNPIEQVYNSVTSTLNTIGAVASPKSDVKLQHLSGPIGIGPIYYLLFENERGWQLALWFSVILNVNLAILNMLPIPVLDGGHIVLAMIESVRRKPVNMRVLEIIQTGCAVLIIGYIAYISFFDVGDFFGSKARYRVSPSRRRRLSHERGSAIASCGIAAIKEACKLR